MQRKSSLIMMTMMMVSMRIKDDYNDRLCHRQEIRISPAKMTTMTMMKMMTMMMSKTKTWWQWWWQRHDDNDNVNDQFVHLWFEVFSAAKNLSDEEQLSRHCPGNQLAHYLQQLLWYFMLRCGHIVSSFYHSLSFNVHRSPLPSTHCSLASGSPMSGQFGATEIGVTWRANQFYGFARFEEEKKLSRIVVFQICLNRYSK